MAYVTPNFKTKAAFRKALKEGQVCNVFQPGPFPLSLTKPENKTYVEGPHYPEPHRWYASVLVSPSGKVLKITG